MSMSTDVVCFISPEDEEYKKHSAVLQACLNAGIRKLPEETANYFGDDFPDPYLFEKKLTITTPIHEWERDSSQGYEILVSEIPKGVYKIRFYNSW